MARWFDDAVNACDPQVIGAMRRIVVAVANSASTTDALADLQQALVNYSASRNLPPLPPVTGPHGERTHTPRLANTTAALADLQT